MLELVEGWLGLLELPSENQRLLNTVYAYLAIVPAVLMAGTMFRTMWRETFAPPRNEWNKPRKALGVAGGIACGVIVAVISGAVTWLVCFLLMMIAVSYATLLLRQWIALLLGLLFGVFAYVGALREHHREKESLPLKVVFGQLGIIPASAISVAVLWLVVPAVLQCASNIDRCF